MHSVLCWGYTGRVSLGEWHLSERLWVRKLTKQGVKEHSKHRVACAKPMYGMQLSTPLGIWNKASGDDTARTSVKATGVKTQAETVYPRHCKCWQKFLKLCYNNGPFRSYWCSYSAQVPLVWKLWNLRNSKACAYTLPCSSFKNLFYIKLESP